MGDRLKYKVALVSRAGSSGPGWGNGKATAVLFAREGAKVLAADLKLDAAVETKLIIESEGGICVAVAGNVSRADDVAAMSTPASRHLAGSTYCTAKSASLKSAVH
jgi:NAD(P)-dependent dehydrogenase (short-subunit alcohol dehydrogenase family)